MHIYICMYIYMHIYLEHVGTCWNSDWRGLEEFFSGLRWMTASRLASSPRPPKDPDDLAAEECLGRHRRSADAADSRFSIFLR